MPSDSRSRSKPNARTLRGIIEELERRRVYLSGLITERQAERAPAPIIGAMRSELAALEGAIDRLREPTLPVDPPFEAPPAVLDEWRQAVTWPAERQMLLLLGTLARLAERGGCSSADQDIAEAFRGAHYEVRSDVRHVAHRA